MDDSINSLNLLLSDVILPALKAVQGHQAEQIAANDRVEQAIEDLRAHIDAQFAMLSSQLAACRVELLATQAALKAAQAVLQAPQAKTMVH
jgi:hypothetical protein